MWGIPVSRDREEGGGGGEGGGRKGRKHKKKEKRLGEELKMGQRHRSIDSQVNLCVCAIFFSF